MIKGGSSYADQSDDHRISAHELQEIRAEIDKLEALIDNEPDPDKKAVLQSRLLFLERQHVMLDNLRNQLYR